MPALFFSLLLLFVGCSSAYNTVRLKQMNAGQKFSLVTQHYLQTDHDHVAELDRGERRVQFDLERTQPLQGEPVTAIKVTLQLYHDDPPPSAEGIMRIDERNVPFTLQQITARESSEKVTVLDTGQRSGSNPALVSEVQAQTGYITFGKPTAAGSVERHWRTYTGYLNESEAILHALSTARNLDFRFQAGGKPALILFRPAQLEAWRRFALNQADETAER